MTDAIGATTDRISEHPLAPPGGADRAPAAARAGRPQTAAFPGRFDWRQIAATVLLVLGAVMLTATWFAISRQTLEAKQLPYLASGGLGGAACVALGVTALLAFEHHRDRLALWEVVTRLDRLEARQAALDGLADTTEPGGAR